MYHEDNLIMLYNFGKKFSESLVNFTYKKLFLIVKQRAFFADFNSTQISMEYVEFLPAPFIAFTNNKFNNRKCMFSEVQGT